MLQLPKEIYRATNQAAHRLALQHEIKARNVLVARLTERLNAGATLPILLQSLQKYEKESAGGTL